MDKQLRSYLVNKLRNYEKDKKKLEMLKKILEERRMDIIEEQPAYMDGQPKGKGVTSNPTQSKVIRLDMLEKRIKALEWDFEAIKRFEEKISGMDEIMMRIYRDTLRGRQNLEYKAMDYGMAVRTLYNYRTKLLKLLAIEMGECLDLEELI